MNKKLYFIIPAVIVAMIIVLILLIPIENKRKFYEKYGVLAVNAETDEKSKYIVDNLDKYPEDILELYYFDYDEFIDFVYNYPFHKNDYANMKYTESELNSDQVPYLSMNDNRWAYEEYDGGYIRTDGCALVSLTMAYLYLTGKDDIDPAKIGRLSDSIDGAATFGGVASDKVVELASLIGLNAVEHDYSPLSDNEGNADINVIKNALAENKAVMAGMTGETFGGHAIIIRQCNDDGTIYINDPADVEKSEIPWNFYDIQPEMYFIWELTAAE